MKEIQLQDAKASLSQVVNDALAGSPSTITRHGRKEAVLLSYEEWQRLSRGVPSFAEFLLAAPFSDEDLPERDRMPRDIDL